MKHRCFLKYHKTHKVNCVFKKGKTNKTMHRTFGKNCFFFLYFFFFFTKPHYNDTEWIPGSAVWVTAIYRVWYTVIWKVDDYHTEYICLSMTLNSTVLSFIKRIIFQVYIKCCVCRDSLAVYEILRKCLFDPETLLFGYIQGHCNG